MRLAPTSHRARCAPLTSLASSGDHDAQRAKGYSVSAPERPSRGISSPSASPYPPTGRRASSPCTRTPRSASLTLTGRRPRGAKSAPEPGLSDDRRSDDTGREPGHVTIGSIAPAACAFLGFDRASIGLVLRICGANGSGHRASFPSGALAACALAARGRWRRRPFPTRLRLRPSLRWFGLLAGRRWLGRQDSNLGMAEPKSAALPLGDAPSLLLSLSARSHARQESGLRSGSAKAPRWREPLRRRTRGCLKQRQSGLEQNERRFALALRRSRLGKAEQPVRHHERAHRQGAGGRLARRFPHPLFPSFQPGHAQA